MISPWFFLVPPKNIDTECALMQLAAYLWECEILIHDCLEGVKNEHDTT